MSFKMCKLIYMTLVYCFGDFVKIKFIYLLVIRLTFCTVKYIYSVFNFTDLLRAYLEWIPESQHTELESMWPPT